MSSKPATKTSKGVLALSVVAALLVFAANEARGDSIIPTLVSIAPNGIGGFTWTYSMELASGFSLDPSKTWTSTPDGQFFTIYDFGGFTGTTSQPAGWSFSSSNLGVTPASTAPADDPTLPNLTWTYSGAFLGSASSPTSLGMFTADSLYGGMTTDDFTSQDTVISTGARGFFGTSTTVALVPEPSVLLLMGAGLVALALHRRGKGFRIVASDTKKNTIHI